MPTYDVECSKCGFVGEETIKLAALDAWDLAKKCPTCACATAEFRRVINSAPAFQSGAKAPAKGKPLTSGEKDDMMHRNAKHRNPDIIAAARESVAKGEFEGFKN